MPTKWIFAQRLPQRTEPSLTDPKASCSFYQSCFVLTPSHPTCEQKVHPPPCLNHRLIHFEPPSLPPPPLLFAHLEEEKEKEEGRKRASGFEACLTESLSPTTDHVLHAGLREREFLTAQRRKRREALTVRNARNFCSVPLKIFLSLNDPQRKGSRDKGS